MDSAICGRKVRELTHHTSSITNAALVAGKIQKMVAERALNREREKRDHDMPTGIRVAQNDNPMLFQNARHDTTHAAPTLLAHLPAEHLISYIKLC